MFKQILVAVDGSHTSGLALQEAIKLGKEFQSALRVVHVVDEVSLNWPESGDFLAVTETFRKAGQMIHDKAKDEMQKAGLTPEAKLLEIETLGHRVAEVIAATETTSGAAWTGIRTTSDTSSPATSARSWPT